MKKYLHSSHYAPAVAAGVDDNAGSTAATGQWTSLKNWDSLRVVYLSSGGSAGQSVRVQLRQAKSAAGADAKDLAAGQWWAAQAASIGDALAAAGSDGGFTDARSTACLAVAEITADELDVDGGYTHVAVEVEGGAATAGKQYAAAYILSGGRYEQALDAQPTALA